MLTIDRLKKLLYYEPITGEWYWRISPSNSIKAGSLAGTIKSDGYRRIRIDGQSYYSGQLAFLYMEGAWSENQIDHENRLRSDDRWENLREATASDNNANRSMQANNTTGYRGISLFQGKYDVRVNRKHIGYFDDLGEAIIARDSWAIKLQGQFAYLNSSQGELP